MILNTRKMCHSGNFWGRLKFILKRSWMWETYYYSEGPVTLIMNKSLPSWYLAVVHVGGHDDARLPFVSLSENRSMWLWKCFFTQFNIFTAKLADVHSCCTDLAMENHHVIGVRGQPGLHGFTHSTDPIQGRGVKIRPAVVLHLNRRGGEMFKTTVVFRLI